MAIVLFTDFGTADLYVGQVKAVLADQAPAVPIIDLLNDARSFDIEDAAHLLAALAPTFPRGAVFLAVVDPGVGTRREPVLLEADGHYYVGPDNGLLSIVYQRARARHCATIAWQPPRLSSSFHGRDLFAPVAARLACGTLRAEWWAPKPRLDVLFNPGPLARVIYVDHFGNCVTGIPARDVDRNVRVIAGGRELRFCRVFGEAESGSPFWYENSFGLVELAVDRASAAAALGIGAGASVKILHGTTSTR